jgi:hypothetical protein
MSENRISFKITCGLCKRKYELLKLSDMSWIRNRLRLSDSALVGFKTIYGNNNPDLEMVVSNIKGIARVGRKSIHIVFELFGIRAYFDCSEKNGVLSAILTQEV